MIDMAVMQRELVQAHITKVDSFIDPFVRCFWCKGHMENFTAYNQCYQTKAHCQPCGCFYQFTWDEANNWELIMVVEEGLSVKTNYATNMLVPECWLIENSSGVAFEVSFHNDIMQSKSMMIQKMQNLKFLDSGKVL